MPESTADLLRLNLFDCEIEKVKYYTLFSTRSDLVLKSGQLRSPVPVLTTLENHHKDKWQYEDFDYKLSSLGFRGDEIPHEVDLAAFGCSYTFGIGLPENKLWHRLLSESSYNFGQPGASITAIADIFHILSNHVKMNRAIFLLPNYMRDLMALESRGQINLWSLMPSTPDINLKYPDIIQEAHYKYTPDSEFIRKMKDSVYLIEHVAKNKNIKLFFSSWDGPTYEMLTNMNFNHATVIDKWTWPKWTLPSEVVFTKDLARDMLHPGMAHHKYWSELIKNKV